jgi:hypothetical protein
MRRRKPAGYVPGAETIRTRSLDTFAAEHRPSHQQILFWLEQHPALVEEIRQGLTQYSDHIIWRWLREEHGFPFSVSVITGIRRDKKDARLVR